VIYEHGKPLWNVTDIRKPKKCEKNMSQCLFVYHKSHMHYLKDRLFQKKSTHNPGTVHLKQMRVIELVRKF
jgi:hypothetical protein